MLVNRGAIPSATFVALALLQRLLPHIEFETFLLLFSASQWFLAFGFQWQKNVVVRFHHLQNYRRISTIVLWSTCAILSSIFLFSTHASANELSIGAVLFLVSSGSAYYYSTNYRMKGSVTKYAFLDTLFQIMRWCGAVVAVLIVPVHSAAFWGMAGVILAASIMFAVLERRIVEPNAGTERLSWGTYISVGAWLAAFDFSGAGMMYIDRFYVQDASYILHSTLGNQVGSVLFGALVAATYPRVAMRFAQGGGSWRDELNRMIKYSPFLTLASIAICVAVGPVLLYLISPGAPVSLATLGLHALSQSLHYIITLLCIPFILIKRNMLPTIIYAVFFLMFLALLQFQSSTDWIMVSSMRCVILFIALIAIMVAAQIVMKDKRWA